jgi:branched-chain amino acid transport system permease protein
MLELTIILARGLGTGAVYALIAMSFNVVYNASGILNFAQGTLLVVAGLFAAFVVPSDPSLLGWLILVPIVGIGLAIVVTSQGFITLLPLRSSVEQHSWLITTMAVSVIIGALILLVQGPFARTVPTPFPSIYVVGTRMPSAYAQAMVLMEVWFFGLRWFYRRTLTGLAISALAQDLEAARVAGLRARRLQLTAFAVSGAILGTTGFVAAPIISISADSGIIYVLNGFIAAVVGGMGSDLGAMIGGPLVGVTAMIATYSLGGEFQSAISLALLVGVLMVRPQGLLGRTSARQV